MPKVKIIRKGAKRPVAVPVQMARHLTKTRNWNYAEEDAAVSRSKRKPESKHARHGDDAVQAASAAEKETPQAARPQAVKALEDLPKGLAMSAEPMTSKHVQVKPTQRAAMTRAELEDMTKADLKALGQKLGVELKASEPKVEWVDRLNRYMRRDMRAAR